jgi:hypothetical protein
MQETSYWPAHCWNVMSEQRKSNRQHLNTYIGSGKKPSTPQPMKAVQITADPSRDVILEAVHFLVEIGYPRHARLNGIHVIRSLWL